MSDEDIQGHGDSGDGDGKRKRRRRRRPRRGGGEDGAYGATPDGTRSNSGSSASSNSGPNQDSGGEPRKRGRRQAVEMDGPVASVPSTGRNPQRKRSSRPKRSAPTSAGGRRRRLNRTEAKAVTAWVSRMPDSLLANLYKGLGGQPKRVPNGERMVQLAVRAIAQTSRMGSLLKSLHERDRKALSALLQAGGIAHASEFHRELGLSFGGQERDWKRSMTILAERGLVMATHEADGEFFYMLVEPLVDTIAMHLEEEMALPLFTHDDMRIIEERPFCPPLDFSITTLATYIDQHSPRLTQRQEIYRSDQEAMDGFFGQLWEPESELFAFHLDFLMMHSMIELRGEWLSLNREVMEEWLSLEPEDQRDLMFRSLEKRFPLAEWVLWAIHATTADEPEGWVAERPLMATYRRWKRGEDWRDRFERQTFASSRTHERDSFSFAPLVRAGVLEMGQWGQEKFYRLSSRGRHMLSPPENDGFQQFYLTPSFEIMAPAGLAPVLLFRIGELAELVGCDRANTYKITQPVVEKALDAGWKRDDVLQFLRDNSQIGLPENVEQTLKGWIGHRGDVEFHELTLMTVHRSQIRRLESNKRIKPYLLHRFAPGAYAVDPARLDEIRGVLADSKFDPAKETRRYPGDPEQQEARQNLHKIVAEAREALNDPVARSMALIEPEKLRPVPGAKVVKIGGEAPAEIPTVTIVEARVLIEKAMSKERDLEMVYLTSGGQRMECLVQPQRMAFKSDTPVLVGLDINENERRSFLLDRIERMRIQDEE